MELWENIYEPEIDEIHGMYVIPPDDGGPFH